MNLHGFYYTICGIDLLDLGSKDQITFTLIPSFYSNMVLFMQVVCDIICK